MVSQSLDATISSQLLTPSLLRPSGFLDQTTFTEHTSSMTLAQLVQRLMGSSTASVIDVQQVIGAAACAISCCEREFGNIGSSTSFPLKRARFVLSKFPSFISSISDPTIPPRPMGIYR